MRAKMSSASNPAPSPRPESPVHSKYPIRMGAITGPARGCFAQFRCRSKVPIGLYRDCPDPQLRGTGLVRRVFASQWAGVRGHVRRIVASEPN